MKALDTNVLARLLLADDAAQLARAKALLNQPEIFTAPVTVMLELVWVLEANDCTPAHIARGLALLLDLPNFRPAHAPELRQALAWYASGMDFADALHLALKEPADAVYTFDKRWIKVAKREGLEQAVLDVPALRR